MILLARPNAHSLDSRYSYFKMKILSCEILTYNNTTSRDCG